MSSLKTPNVIQRLKTVIGFYILGVLLMPTTGCSSAKHTLASGEENQGWEMVKVDKNAHPSWTIYTRKIVGTDFLEYKIEGGIKSSPEECVTAVKQDLLNQASSPKNKKYPTYQITDESKDCLLTYVIHNEPFPLKDTEMSVRYTFFNDEEEGSAGVRWKEAWDECEVQPSKKLNRIETFRGSWKFSPTSNTSCQAATSVQFNPKKMPLWLVEPMVNKFLKEGLEDLRKTTSKQMSKYITYDKK